MELVNGWLESYGDSAVYLLFILAFAEACVVIGLFISGAFLLLLSSVLYSNDVVGLETIMLLGFTGATLGDHLGFYCGVFLGPGFHQSKWVVRNRSRLEKSEAIIKKYGGFAIFIGRFVPAVRSVVPALIGISGFNRKRYTLLDLTACAVWSGALAIIVLGIDNTF